MTRVNLEKKISAWNCLSHCLRRRLWNPICRNGCMTSTRSPLSLLGDHMVQFMRTEAGARAMTRFSEAGLGADSARHLAAWLRQGERVAQRPGRIRLVEFLATLAPDDEVAALCLVVLLRPELTWITRITTSELVGPEEAEADALALSWEVVTTGHGDAEPIRHPALINAIWTRVRRSCGLRRGHLETIPLAHEFDRPAPLDDRLERWPGLLAAAVARGVLTPRQVVVIAQTRMEGRPLIEVANALGRTYDSLRMERARAEAALRQFAFSYVEVDEQ
jgi:hypothetical protein